MNESCSAEISSHGGPLGGALRSCVPTEVGARACIPLSPARVERGQLRLLLACFPQCPPVVNTASEVQRTPASTRSADDALLVPGSTDGFEFFDWDTWVSTQISPSKVGVFFLYLYPAPSTLGCTSCGTMSFFAVVLTSLSDAQGAPANSVDDACVEASGSSRVGLSDARSNALLIPGSTDGFDFFDWDTWVSSQPAPAQVRDLRDCTLVGLPPLCRPT